MFCIDLSSKGNFEVEYKIEGFRLNFGVRFEFDMRNMLMNVESRSPCQVNFIIPCGTK